MESGSSSTGGGDSPGGLNFGNKVFFGGSSGAAAERKGKGAAPAAAAAAPRCQVEGCGVDLTGSKAYYCRHKVCGSHSKSPVVVVAGIEQRFCQQCSRFHQLHEFDQGKRSCRRRLAGHNERRRKPVLGTIGRRLPSPCRPPFQGDGGGRLVGGFLMDFSHPRMPATEGELWPRVRVDEPPAAPWPGSAAGYHGAFGHSYLQALSGGTLFSHSVEELGVSDAGCALSLLSTQPWGSAGGAAMRNPSPVEGFASGSWDLKGHDGGASAISGDGQFSGEPSPDSGTGRVSGFSGVHLPWLP